MAEKNNVEGGASVVKGGSSYFASSLEELKKIHTPTRQETIRQTWVVLIIIAFISFCLFVLDLVFSWVMHGLVSR